MAISGTFKIAESNNTSLIKMAFDDIYTLLDLDYTIERSFDKTGRPSGKASISFIKVTIRAIKEKDTPFHKWINDPDSKMNGEINIYDSAGLISSTVQDVTGGDPLIDVTDDLVGLPSDIISGEMNEGMDNASNYNTREHDFYDEMTHADLLEQAKNNHITIMAGDSDDVIKDKLRKINKKYEDLADEETLKKFMKEHNDVEWPSKENETKDMTLEELKEYATKNKLTDAPEKKDNEKDDEYLERYRAYVREHMELKAAKEMVKNRSDEKLKDAVMSDVEKQVKDEKIVQSPLYQTADKMKAKTVSAAKTIVSGATKRFAECSRTIEFVNAYCVSLREHFTNNPDSKGTLDKSYPWTFEIGIKPQKVTVSGYQLGPLPFGEKTEFVLYQ